MSAQDNATVIQSLIQAYNHQDAEQFAANATEDCETLDVPGGMTFRGPDGLRHCIQENITAFPDGQIQATSLFTTDDDGLLEIIGRGTNTGPLMSPMGQFPPTVGYSNSGTVLSTSSATARSPVFTSSTTG